MLKSGKKSKPSDDDELVVELTSIEELHALITAEIHATGITPTGYNSFNRYKYANDVDLTTTIMPIVSKYGASIVCSSEELSFELREVEDDEKTRLLLVSQQRVTAKLIHPSFPGESVEASVTGVSFGFDDKSSWKSITNAKKYAQRLLFNLSVDKDAESDNNESNFRGRSTRGGGRGSRTTREKR